MQQLQIKSLNKIKLFWMKPKKKEQFDKDAAEDDKYLEEFYKCRANEEPKTNSSPMSNYIPLTLSNLPLR